MDQLKFIPESHEYWVGEQRVPNVTGIIDYWNLIDTTHYPEEVKEDGSALHLACEYDDLGVLHEPSLTPPMVNRIQAYRAFKENHECVWDMTEKKLYHPKFWYAGTLDRSGLVVIDNEPRQTLVDLKRGLFLPCYRLQTAAYVMMATLVHQEKNPLNWYRMILQLRKDGKYVPTMLYPDTLMADFQGFLGYLNAMNWEKANNIKREVKREEQRSAA